mmetsp:Transcript_5309/g.12866  ORF Transcript_5309/g.12866 Transcript_5309/m.12866 type:complete len:121 (-) Transcript_5309:20-382(-)
MSSEKRSDISDASRRELEAFLDLAELALEVAALLGAFPISVSPELAALPKQFPMLRPHVTSRHVASRRVASRSPLNSQCTTDCDGTHKRPSTHRPAAAAACDRPDEARPFDAMRRAEAAS